MKVQSLLRSKCLSNLPTCFRGSSGFESPPPAFALPELRCFLIYHFPTVSNLRVLADRLTVKVCLRTTMMASSIGQKTVIRSRTGTTEREHVASDFVVP